MPFYLLPMLTQSQLLALDHTRHLCVTANAGSGKTRVLVERYLDILLSGNADVSEVVAITFTEKAASELKRKVAAGVSQKLKNTADDRTRQQLETIREQLPAAVIGTIHAFCSRILREYPVEAGVDASFVVLEGIDQEFLLQEAIRETFYSVLASKEDEAFRGEVFDLVRRLGKSAVLRSVAELCHHREQVERLVGEGGLYTQSDGNVLAFWNSLLDERLRKELEGKTLEEDVSEVAESARGKEALAVRADTRRFLSTADVHIRAREFLQLVDKMVTKGGTLYKSLMGGAEIDGEIPKRLRKQRKLVGALVETVLGPQPNPLHTILLQSTRCLLKIYQQTIERYETTKLENGQLDFDDLQLRTRNLLKREPIRSRLAQRYKYIMVDEYQDTNKLQYEILLPLVSDLKTGNLFIVGDPKQSIYGFRNADVSVFEKTRMDIQEASGLWGTVVLGESFRPLRDLAAFVNLIFTPLMKKSVGVQAAYEVGYEPLVKARGNESTGRVEILVREQGELDTTGPGEGEMIARRILQLQASHYQVFDKNEQGHDLQFRDIAILMRSRRLLDDIEQSLVHYHIPYLVTAGIGYFQTQMTYDFYNYFRFLLNVEDDVALAGILRSPFFTVSDAELYEAAGDHRAGGLWQHFTSDKSQSDRFPSLARALQMLSEDMVLSQRLTVPELITRIVQRTGYMGIAAGIPRGDQIVANLGKLRHLAETFAGRGFVNLYDFVKRLKRLIEEEEQEGQGMIDVQRDAVQIMTVHAAKGLEFPVVVLPGLEASFQHDRAPFMDDTIGIGLELSSDEEDQPAVTTLLKHRARSKSIAEEKRVLYVACTRARDLLILSSPLTAEKKASYMQWLSEGLGLKGPPLENVIERRVMTAVVNGDGISTNEEHPLRVHLVRNQDLMGVVGAKPLSPLSREFGSLHIEAIQGQNKGEIFSASKIRTYKECPAKYYLRYILGLPDASPISSSEPEVEDEESQLAASTRGSLLHHIMERIDKVEGSSAALRNIVREAVVSTFAFQSEVESIVNEMTETIKSILESQVWLDILQGTEQKTECTITTTFGDDFLTGKIDRLFKEPSGIWHVVDYKTDAIDFSELQQRSDFYMPQLGFYAFLVHKTKAVDRVNATLLFTNHLAKPVRMTYELDDFSAMEADMRSIIQSITNFNFNTLEKPCRSCPFLPDGCSSALVPRT